MHTIEDLDVSTACLYERFGLDSKSIPPSKRRKIFMEEVAEFQEASALYEFSDDTWVTSTELVNEAADVIVTIIGLLQSHDIKYYELEVAIDRVIRKNNAKTLETHALINGKITRKQVMP